MDKLVIGRATVRVYRADGLAAADLNGKSDPFAVIRLVNEVHKTKTQYRTLNPEWNETFEMPINDVHEHIDIHVYDEDRHGVDFLGRVCIPLLKVHSGRRFWYQLKNKSLKRPAKGRILLQIHLQLDEQWLVKSCWRTFNPRTVCESKERSTLKKSLLVTHFNRLKYQASQLMQVARYVQSCFEWTSRRRSATAFVLFLLITYYFQLWMLPFALLLLFAFNCACLELPAFRSYLGLPEPVVLDELSQQKLILTTIAALDSQDEPFDMYSTTVVPENATTTPDTSTTTTTITTTKDIVSAMGGFSFNCKLFSNKNKSSTQTAATSHDHSATNDSGPNLNNTNQIINNNNSPDQDNKNLLQRIQAVPDVVILVQDIIGNIASYGERIVNTLTFKVRYLSYLMMFCCGVATILLYFVPLRCIVLAWGINKFTKKLRNPDTIDNNELLDFLSRVPDDIQILKYHNEIVEVPAEVTPPPQASHISPVVASNELKKLAHTKVE